MEQQQTTADILNDLGLKLEKRGDVYVVDFGKGSGCRPATCAEIKMWEILVNRLDFYGKWMPIDSAPTDGTPIIVGALSEAYSVGEACFYGGEWFYLDSDGAAFAVYADNYLTHWMPLPPPPKE